MAIHDFLARATGMTWGLPLAVVAIVIAYHDYSQGRRPWRTAVALAAAGGVDAYSAVFAVLALTFFLYGSRRPSRTLAWLALSVSTALGLVAFALGPWLREWMEGSGVRRPRGADALVTGGGWALAITDTMVIAAGTAALALASRSRGGLDRRLAFALHAAAVAAVLPHLLPALPLSESPVRFADFGLAGALGAALTLATAVALGLRITKERRLARVPVPKEMPRALTPTLLEASPPPPPPRRWGTLVPLAVWTLLLCWRLAR